MIRNIYIYSLVNQSLGFVYSWTFTEKWSLYIIFAVIGVSLSNRRPRPANHFQDFFFYFCQIMPLIYACTQWSVLLGTFHFRKQNFFQLNVEVAGRLGGHNLVHLILEMYILYVNWYRWVCHGCVLPKQINDQKPVHRAAWNSSLWLHKTHLMSMINFHSWLETRSQSCTLMQSALTALDATC